MKVLEGSEELEGTKIAGLELYFLENNQA